MDHILSDESARWPSLGHPNLLEIGQPAAAKVSPALDKSSAWAYGYTPRQVVVVRLSVENGNQADPLTAAAIWQAILKYGVRGLPADGWEMPAGVVSLYVCDPSGLLPTSSCPNVINEVFLENQKPVSQDAFFQAFPVNRETGLLATVFTPPEMVEERTYMVLPAVALPWAEANDIQPPPSSYDTLSQPRSLPDVEITSPGMFSCQTGLLEILPVGIWPGVVPAGVDAGGF
jgi:membrane carboxypeptidase/penicillin-binding protein PbpC